MKHNRIYVCAPLTEIERARKAAAQMEAVGFEVVSTWHATDATVAKERALLTSAARDIAETCLKEVRRADCMLAFYDPAARTGHVVELGIAIGCLMPIAVIRLDRGERPTVFLHARDVEIVDDVPGAIAALEGGLREV